MRSILCSILCLTMVSLLAGQTWNPVTTLSGYKNIKDIAINTDGNILFAADETKLLSSTNAGASWTQISSFAASPTAVACKFDQLSLSSMVVVASGPNAFKKSTNGGTDWTDISATNKPTCLVNLTNDPGVWLLGRRYLSTTERCIQRSTNDGTSWTSVLASSYTTTIYDIAVNVSDYKAMAAGAGSSGATDRGIWYAADAKTSSSWSLKTGTSTIDWTAVTFINKTGADVVIAGTATGLLYSGAWTGGLTQVASFPGNGDTIRTLRLEVTRTSPSLAYNIYVGTDRTLYKGTNDNGSWSWSPYWTSGMYDPRTYSIAAYPKDGPITNMFAGSRGFLYRSTNAGSSWSAVTSSQTTTFPAQSFFVSGSNYWTASYDLTVAGLYDGSAVYPKRLEIDPALVIGKQMSVVSTATGKNNLIAGQRNTSSASASSGLLINANPTDNGSVWTIVSQISSTVNTTSCEGTYVDVTSPKRVIAFGKFNNTLTGNADRNYLLNDNYGADGSWTSKNTSVNGSSKIVAFTALGDANHDYYFAGLQGAGLWRTGNFSASGPSWSQIGQGVLGNVTVNAVASNATVSGRTQDTLYAGASSGLWAISKAGTTDYASVNVTPRFSSPEVTRIVMDQRGMSSEYPSSCIFFLGADNNVYQSRDGGQSKSVVTGNLSGYALTDLRVDTLNKTFLFVSTDHGLYKIQTVGVPSLASPGNQATNVQACPNPTLQWTAPAEGASVSTYHLQVASDSLFANLLVDQSSLTTPSFQTTFVPQLSTTYYWRVSASNSSNGFGEGPWSRMWRFQTNGTYGPPALTTPTDGATGISNCRATVSWSAVACANPTYHAQIDTSPSFNSQKLQDATNINGVQNTFTGLFCNTRYYWHVATTNAVGDGPYSAYRSFTTGCPTPTNPPVLSDPSNNSISVSWCSNVTFDWFPAGGGIIDYHVQIDTSAGFGSPLKIDTIVTSAFQCVLGPNRLQCNLHYVWHVASRSCNGESGFSGNWNFTTTPCAPVISLNAPVNNQTGVGFCPPPVMQWSYTGCVDSFRIEVSTGNGVNQDGSFTNPDKDNVRMAIATSYQIAQNLAVSTQYYWHIGGKKGGSAWSWSATSAFTTGPGLVPAADTLVSPTSGSTLQTQNTATLTWKPISDAGSYHVELWQSGQPILDSATVSGTSMTVGNLNASTIYFWWVRAQNCNNYGPFSAQSWFITCTSGCIQGVADADRPEGEKPKTVTAMPTAYTVEQNYPNPFNPTTRFAYGIPNDAHVQLRIFNILGQEVASVVNEFQNAGYKSVEFDASRLPSGVYFYRLQAGTFVTIKKMLYMK
jgi:hypothetical protein